MLSVKISMMSTETRARQQITIVKERKHGIHATDNVIDEFGTIRTIQMNGEIYFVGKDVAEALGYSNTRDAIAKHVEIEDKSDVAIHDGSQNRTMTAINESGLYALILGSKLESAKRFKHWVTSEVLPTIRKTGGYVNNEELFINTYFPFADENTKNMFSQTLRTIREQNEIIQKQTKEIMHKEDVIIGLVEDIDLATKRQRITQIVRHCEKKNYQERYRLLYDEFARKYHCDLKYRMENDVLKPKAKNKMDYIDRGMNMIPQLYEITCKLFENDVEALKAEWDSVVA